MATRWWKVTSSLLRLSTRVTTLRTSVANSYPKATLRHLNTSNLKLSEEKETFHFMPLSYNEDVRAVSGIYAPDEPPQAPLPLDHELNGECDFSRQLDMVSSYFLCCGVWWDNSLYSTRTFLIEKQL